MADAVVNQRSQVFDLLIDFIHRAIAEGKDPKEIRKSAVLFVCGRVQ
jgi:hypothetical protein